jgi:hypothetical protein
MHVLYVQVVNTLHRAKLLKAMQRQLLGLGHEPGAVEVSGLIIRLHWPHANVHISTESHNKCINKKAHLYSCTDCKAGPAEVLSFCRGSWGFQT